MADELTGTIGGAAVGGGFGGALVKGDKGDKGDTGPAPSFTIGTVSTIPSGGSATASLSSTEEGEYQLNLGLPAGATGLTGPRGPGAGWAVRKSGLWHRPVGCTIEQGALANIVAGRIMLSEFRFPEACTLNKLRAWNSGNTVLAGKNLKFLVYGLDSAGMPGARLFASGARSLSNSSSVYIESGIALSLSAGSYYIGCVFDSTISSGSNFACFLTRNGAVTDDPTDTGQGCWDAFGYDSSYSSPQATALDGTLSRIRLQYTSAPVILAEVI